jgi:signal transduction histidine kinase
MSEGSLEAQSALLQVLPEAALLVNEEGFILATNPAFRRMASLPKLGELRLGDVTTDPANKVAHYLHLCAGTRQPVVGNLTFAPGIDLTPDPTPGLTPGNPTANIPAPGAAERAPQGQAHRCEGAVVKPWSPASPAIILLRFPQREVGAGRFALLTRTIDELNQEIRERRQAEARLRLLADVSNFLTASLDPRAILQQVTECVAGAFADWCMIYLVEKNGEVETLQRVATAHVNPAKMELARRLSQRSPRYAVPEPFVEVMRSGQPYFLPEFDEASLLSDVRDSEQSALIQRLEPKSVMAVPLAARGNTLGTLALVWSESDQRYSEADLDFATQLAQRIALMVENAALYQEARAAEQQLRDFNRSLEKLVAERTAELQRSNQELDQFAYIASHDLKAPLRAINYLATWIGEDSDNTLSPVVTGHLAKMRQRIARMEKLLDDLLAFSRAGRRSHEPERISSLTLVQNVVDLVGPPRGFEVEISPALPELYSERVPLETIFRNLISNAVKHHLQPEQGKVWIEATQLPDRIEFAVRDNGPGIEPVYHARIFEIFQSLKPRDHSEGSGIGLAVVKKIVERHGGVVRVESVVGQGATFYFTWPTVATATPIKTLPA